MSRDRVHIQPEGCYVTLYCKAQSHAGQPWIIATWTRHAGNDGTVYWSESRDQYLAGVLVRRTTDQEKPTRTLVADAAGELRRINPTTLEGHMELMRAQTSDTAHYTSRLRCHLCGEAIKRAGANLQRDLERLSAAGRTDVSLTEYRVVTRPTRRVP